MISLVLFMLLTFASSLTASHAPKQMDAERTIRDLVDLALVAPPELAADVLLKLIEHGYITDAKWKRELLDTAWSLASRATYTSEVAPALDSAGASDTDSGSLSAALATGLSTAGLQARIISQMAKLDAPETRKLFLQMSVPADESLSCSADRYTSHRPYFEALTVVVQTFSAEETKSGERLKFLADALRSLTNPEDFELSYPLVQSDQRTDEELRWLMTSWSESLSAAHFSDRLFSSRSIENLANPILFGGKRAELRGASTGFAVRALRSYFIRHARTSRCGESRSRTAEEEALRTAFNKSAAATRSFETAVIDAADIAAESFGETAKIISYAGNDDRIREMKADYIHLRFGSEVRQVSGDYLRVDERSTPEWSDKALQFLSKLEGWSNEFSQSNRELFFQKAKWFGALVYSAPEGKLRQSLLDNYLKFLANSPTKHESPPEWMRQLNGLIAAAGVPDRRAWLDQIERVGDPAIAVYSQLARLRLTQP
jgi:hypothetical protein